MKYCSNVFHSYLFNGRQLVEGDREAGTQENRGGRWAGSDGVGCWSQVTAGGRRRMRDIKFFNDFLVPF